MPIGVYPRTKKHKINWFKKGVEYPWIFKKGHKMNLGKKPSEKTKEKIRQSRLGKFGELAPGWKGGISSLQKLFYHCFKYRQWRSDIFTRDDFTCQNCNGRGGLLEPHHIKRVTIIIKEYKIKTLEQALACEELWNVNNGITLCKKCHRLKHNLNGRREK